MSVIRDSTDWTSVSLVCFQRMRTHNIQMKDIAYSLERTKNTAVDWPSTSIIPCLNPSAGGSCIYIDLSNSNVGAHITLLSKASLFYDTVYLIIVVNN